MPSRNNVKTFIPLLDEALGGGIENGTGLGIYGEQGLGKTILSLQIAYNNIQNGRTCSYHAHDQSASKLKERMKAFGWDPDPYSENFQVLDFFTMTAPSFEELEVISEVSLEELLSREYDTVSLLRYANKEMKDYFGGYPDLLIVDSATPLLIQMGGRSLYLLLQMAKKLFLKNTASVVTLHSEIVDQKTLNSLFSLSDYFLKMGKMEGSLYTMNIEKSMKRITWPTIQYRLSRNGIETMDRTVSRTRL
jgi:KaiC/GvpD/RAD55 family RecA-like ATPase